MLYIHGYNAAVQDGSIVLGQFMALGNIPTYIKPVIFSWPGGRLMAYLQVTKTSLNKL